MVKWNVTPNGYKWRKFKKDCIEVCRKGDKEPTFFIVINNLVEEYMDVIDGKEEKITNYGEEINDY